MTELLLQDCLYLQLKNCKVNEHTLSNPYYKILFCNMHTFTFQATLQGTT